jgi:hypothetical protein
MNRYAARCVQIAALCLGLFVALRVSGHSSAAFFVGLIGAAAALSSLRELIHYRENRP